MLATHFSSGVQLHLPVDFKWSLKRVRVWPWLDQQPELAMCAG